MKNKYTNKYLLETGMGLQDVDGLKNSEYFLSQSSRYIRGEITLDELDQIINSYYQDKPENEERNQEADKVTMKIARIISEDSFTFSVGQLLTIHRFLFENILKHPGEMRTFNFIKKEWVLDGDSVTYGDYRELEMTLQYDFEQERKYRFNVLSIDEVIEHLAIFVANLWQIHVFEEGNTRAVAVFFIKYLRSLGFDVTNDMFAKNAWYFRNSLVRANYKNIKKGIYEDRSFLIKFLRNLLLNEHNVLKNRDLHINAKEIKEESSREARVVGLIKENPHITSDELATKLGISIRTLKTVTKSLVDNNVIKRSGGKRFGYWEIIEKK